MLIAAIASVAFAFLAARSVVAEADAHRLERPDRWWDPHCERCDAPLGATMIRCRADGHLQRLVTISTLPLMVLLCGAVPLVVPSLWLVPGYLLFVATVVLLTITDLDTRLIPNRILLRGGLAAVPLLVIGGLLDSQPGAVVRSLAGGAAYFAVMLALALVARGALGFGDVKFAALLGVFTSYLGWGYLVVAGVGAFVLAGATALVLVVLRRVSRSDQIAFGPFMAVGALVAVYVGDAIISWYGR